MNDQIQRLTSATREIASHVETMRNNSVRACVLQVGRDGGALQPIIGCSGAEECGQGGDEHAA
eukprot:2525320-Pyramimonas_sp.AAC.1